MPFKALTDRLPIYLQELFIKCNNDNYYLRNNNSKLALPKPKTNFFKRSFSYRAAQGWNQRRLDSYSQSIMGNLHALRRLALFTR